MALGNPTGKLKIKVEKEYLKEKELLKAVAAKTELTQGKVKEVYKATSDIISDENSKGRKAVIPHIGTFKPKYRASGTRQGMVNPSTKQRGTIEVKETYGIKFKVNKKAGEEFNEKAFASDLVKTHGVPAK